MPEDMKTAPEVNIPEASKAAGKFNLACPPEVQVSSLDPADPLYTALWHKHFALARRVTD